MLCIPKHLTKVFMEKIKSGEITPEKLLDMTSEQRRAEFAKILGKTNAEGVNALFESKMLLKAQQQGIVSWAQEVAGLKPEVKRDILSRVEKMDKFLNPKEYDAFLADLVAHKLGMTVTMQEAGNISALAKDVLEKREAIKTGGDRLEYGRAKVAFDDYYNGLKTESERKKLTEYIKPSNWGQAITNVAGFAKSLKASFDNSVIGRQGLKTLITQPDIWAKNSARSFGDFWNSMTGKDAMLEVRADVMSRPNALNGLYKKHGLAVGVMEEAYPTNLPEKIPLLGRVFKGSQDAFTAWQYRTRADVFDRLADTITKAGGDIEGLGKLVNSLTGRGDIGALEPAAKPLNNIFFSPRFLKSNIDLLTAHAMDKNISPEVRKEAVKNLVKVVGAVAILLAIAKALGGDVEEDPRSADFGKIKIGNTRFDVSGGMASIVVLASRLLTFSSKNATTEIVTKLNEDRFGAKTGYDVLLSFFEGKLSPAAGIVRDILKGKDFQGKKPTILGEMNNLFTPLPVLNFMELRDDPDAAPLLLAMMSDALGIGTNTYSSDIDWLTKTGKEILQFRDKVGDERFAKANKEFNSNYKEWFDRAKDDGRYMSLSDDEKSDMLRKKREEIKNSIFKKYGFRYKPSKKRLPDIK